MADLLGNSPNNQRRVMANRMAVAEQPSMERVETPASGAMSQSQFGNSKPQTAAQKAASQAKLAALLRSR